jgi:glutamate-1-semialdehyde 2,1-aminomutase
MYATRLARAYTGRNKIAKFEGGWHGGYDALHIGVKDPFNVPESAGLTAGALQDTTLLPFNDLEGVKKRLKNQQVASIIIEPILGAGGGVVAEKEFLKGLKEYCDEKEILLIFDEVITGFRLAPGGAQQLYGVKADITVLGKILGGGFPIGAFCGNRKIMERLNAQIYQRPRYAFHGGTFTANPITMTAGLVTLKLLEDGKLINNLNKTGMKVRKRLKEIFDANNVNVQVAGDSSIFNVHFTNEKVKDAAAVYRADRKKLIEFNLSLIAYGVFLLPTHTGALSGAHSEIDLEKLFVETEEYAKKCKAK